VPIRFLLLGAALITACFASADNETGNGSRFPAHAVGVNDVHSKQALLAQKQSELKKLQLEIDRLQAEVVAHASRSATIKTK
jgi:hypothetical protein